ncbi:hypothetical protein ES703_15922 [subsurface metagenome]
MCAKGSGVEMPSSGLVVYLLSGVLPAGREYNSDLVDLSAGGESVYIELAAEGYPPLKYPCLNA